MSKYVKTTERRAFQNHLFQPGSFSLAYKTEIAFAADVTAAIHSKKMSVFFSSLSKSFKTIENLITGVPFFVARSSAENLDSAQKQIADFICKACRNMISCQFECANVVRFYFLKNLPCLWLTVFLNVCNCALQNNQNSAFLVFGESTFMQI